MNKENMTEKEILLEWERQDKIRQDAADAIKSWMNGDITLTFKVSFSEELIKLVAENRLIELNPEQFKDTINEMTGYTKSSWDNDKTEHSVFHCWIRSNAFLVGGLKGLFLKIEEGDEHIDFKIKEFIKEDLFVEEYVSEEDKILKKAIQEPVSSAFKVDFKTESVGISFEGSEFIWLNGEKVISSLKRIVRTHYPKRQFTPKITFRKNEVSLLAVGDWGCSKIYTLANTMTTSYIDSKIKELIEEISEKLY